jgi:hypothetical protein
MDNQELGQQPRPIRPAQMSADKAMVHVFAAWRGKEKD